MRKEYGLTDEKIALEKAESELDKTKREIFAAFYRKAVVIESFTPSTIVDEHTIQASKITAHKLDWAPPSKDKKASEIVRDLQRDSFVENNVFIKLKSTQGYVTGKSYDLNLVCQPFGIQQYTSAQGARLSAQIYETRSSVYTNGSLSVEEMNKYHQKAEEEYQNTLKIAEKIVRDKER